MAAAAVSFLICFKTALFPSLLFAADRDGVRIGRGIFRNVIVEFGWEKVVEIKAAAITHLMPNGLATFMPAVEISFDPSVILPASGDEMAHASGKSNYVVAQRLIRLPLDEVISNLRQLKEDSARS